MCQCIFCDRDIDNLAAAVSLAGDRMHPACYQLYMEELDSVDEYAADDDGVPPLPCDEELVCEEYPYSEELDSDDWSDPNEWHYDEAAHYYDEENFY